MLQKLTFDGDAISKTNPQQSIFPKVNLQSVAKSTRVLLANSLEGKGKMGAICGYRPPFFSFLFAVPYAFQTSI
ncbi:hypothetical protein os1_01390 [Comamonadaceae bacterium OS-1]|nr:hypothetical protein os1_01390 [Comamonadaceae bacterium OS-1]